MTQACGRWASLFLAALAAALLLHAGELTKYFHSSPEKVGVLISGPRTDGGDNYYYFSLLRNATDMLVSPPENSTDIDGGDYRSVNDLSRTYSVALFAGHALYRIASVIAPTALEALLITSILHTTLLAASIVGLIFTLVRWGPSRPLFPMLIVAIAGIVCVDVFSVSLYQGGFRWMIGRNPLRLVNPTLFWAFGLAAATYTVRWMQNQRQSDYLISLLLCCLTPMASIGVGATLAAALGLATAIEVLSMRRIPWRLAGTAALTLLALAWTYMQFWAYAATPLGQDLRHGKLIDFDLRWQFLLLLGLSPFLWRSLQKERTFVISLLFSAAMIGAVCGSFYLGSRLWLRGASIFAWTIAMFLLLRWLIFLRQGIDWRVLETHWLKIVMTIGISIAVVCAQRPDINSWRGFLERDKWELLAWVDRHLPDGTVVATENIEDAFLLPIYTDAKPLYSMYGLTRRTRNNEIQRYFFTMGLYGRSADALQAILKLTKQDMADYYKHIEQTVPYRYTGQVADAAIFLHLVVYWHYSGSYVGVFDDTKQRNVFEKMLVQTSKLARAAKYSVDYAIVSRGNSRTLAMSKWPVAYQNARYALLTNPEKLPVDQQH